MARSSKTLIQRIQMDGGEAIRKELEALGAEGRAAFNALTTAAAKTADAGSDLNRFISSVRKEFEKVAQAGREVGKSLKEVGSAARHTATRVAVLVGAATAAGAALFTLAHRGAQVADEIAKVSAAVGLSVTEYGRMQHAMAQSGVDAQRFEQSMFRLNEEIIRTIEGGSGADTILNRLGISAMGAGGMARSAADVMGDLADLFQTMPDGANKTALAMELFGTRAGPRIIPLLNLGRKGIEDLGDEAQRLGLVLTEEQAKIATTMVDTVALTKAAAAALQRDIGLLFAPGFTNLAEAFTQVIADNRAMLIGWAEDIRDTAMPILEDFIALIEGRDADVNTMGLLAVRDAVMEIAGAVQAVLATGKFLFDVLAGALDPVARAINAIFGTELTGRAIILYALVGKFLGLFRLLGAGIGLVRTVFTQLVNLAGRVTAISTAIVTGLMVGLSTLEQIFVRVADWASTTAGKIVAFFTGATEESQGAVDAAGSAGEEAMGRVSDAAEQAGSGVSNSMQNAAGDAVDAFDTAIPLVEGQMHNLENTSQSVYQKVRGWLRSIISAAKEALAAVAAVAGFSGGGSVEGYSGGGYFRGSGTSTSDSNVIKVSNKEFIMKAAAVRKYGVTLMHQINSMRLPLDGLRGFAGGGLVQGMPSMAVAVPRVPAGGSGAAGRPFALHLGQEVFDGLLAPEDVAERMVQYATRAKAKRTGNMPPWY